MTKPVIELIAENIETVINTVSIANNYNQNLTAKRPRRVDFLNDAWNNLDVIIQQADAEKIGEQPYGCEEWYQNFMIIAIVVGSDTDSFTIDTQKNQVLGDIEKALMVDAGRGGLAIDSEVTGRNFIIDDEAGGAALTFRVHYRTKLGDPYTQI